MGFINSYEKFSENNDYPKLKIRLCGSMDTASNLIYQNKIRLKLNNLKSLDLEYLGLVSDQDRNELYKNSKYFAFPTKGDCFGLSVLEAAYSGCKILSTHKLGIHSILNELNIIEYIDSEKFEFFDLIDKIKEFNYCNNSDLQRKIYDKFSFENYSYNYSNLIKNLKWI